MKKNGLLQTFFYDILKIQVTNWVREILVTFENQSSIIYWFLLRYTVIIYKFTQGNLGAKKNCQKPISVTSQEQKSQIATLATVSAIPACISFIHFNIVDVVTIHLFLPINITYNLRKFFFKPNYNLQVNIKQDNRPPVCQGRYCP